jgi:ribose 5-phosphate isomerase B
MMRIGITADHGGFNLKDYLIEALKKAGYEIRDFGNVRYDNDDDYPDLVVPLARAVAAGQLTPGGGGLRMFS